MKSFLTICLIFCSINLSQAQGECPPVAWCHPDGEGLGYPYTSFLDGMTAAADYLGNLFNGDACENANAAEQVYCYPAKWLADAIPCMYGKDTPQATLCDQGEAPPNGGDGGDGEGGEEPEGQNYSANPNFTPFYTDQKNAKALIQKFLNKTPRGGVITKIGTEYQLKLKSKFYSNKKKTEYVALMELTNAKGKIVGRPILISKGNKMYVHDLVPKKKK
jgi:hypothetical protein